MHAEITGLGYRSVRSLGRGEGGEMASYTLSGNELRKSLRIFHHKNVGSHALLLVGLHALLQVHMRCLAHFTPSTSLLIPWSHTWSFFVFNSLPGGGKLVSFGF